MDVRPAAVAGTFYPGEPAALDAALDALLAGARQPGETPAARTPKALALPHAGYVYSGSTAAAGYALLEPGRGRIDRVVLLGPTHRVPVAGLALPGASALATPLGPVRAGGADPDLSQVLDHVVQAPAVHAQEHSLEVHLPFILRVLGDVEVLPLAVGRATPQVVAGVLDRVWGDESTVVVVSTDLSHYHPYEQARVMDAATLQRVLDLDPTITHDLACGATPLNGLLLAARRRGMTARLIAACNSGDTAGSKGRVVGYAAVAFDEPAR